MVQHNLIHFIFHNLIIIHFHLTNNLFNRKKNSENCRAFSYYKSILKKHNTNKQRLKCVIKHKSHFFIFLNKANQGLIFIIQLSGNTITSDTHQYNRSVTQTVFLKVLKIPEHSQQAVYPKQMSRMKIRCKIVLDIMYDVHALYIY